MSKSYKNDRDLYLPGHVDVDAMSDTAWKQHATASHGVSSASSAPYSSAPIKKWCNHAGLKPVFALTVASDPDAVLTFGGGTGSQVRRTDADVILDLAHVFSVKKSKKFIEDGPPQWLALNSLVKPPGQVVHFDWPDQAAPFGTPARFWQSAVKLIMQRCPKGGHVIACCTGGHGRTGTCLASILLCHSQRTSDDVIDHIREHHCEEAIESKAQEEYLVWLEHDRNANAKGKE